MVSHLRLQKTSIKTYLWEHERLVREREREEKACCASEARLVDSCNGGESQIAVFLIMRAPLSTRALGFRMSTHWGWVGFLHVFWEHAKQVIL